MNMIDESVKPTLQSSTPRIGDLFKVFSMLFINDRGQEMYIPKAIEELAESWFFMSHAMP